ncbi:McrC family protein [Synechococcus sp. CS-1328]|uniref:McrC family protein n=1 Tax=Synechococcus sp. CS-1328 TaxID=2847976 RepID=UPI00223A7A26|nr:McrC family protein [Synechococcus sp. CS-1328]MCT0225590.1 McrC family protein [Synechococcus sp. CS-1328]
MKLIAKDCSPLNPQPTTAQADWLRKVAASIRTGEFVISISGDRDADEPIVYCSWDGTWWAGRYVGSLSFKGHSLTIEPRFGLATLRKWLSEATSLVLIESPGRLRQDESFIVQLLAAVWAHGFVEAARHGLPALRQDVATKDSTIRGRLDVAASIQLIASKGREVVSIRSERSLDHAASDAIIAAYGVLRRWLGVPDDQWMPARGKELIPHLMAVTGPRPRVPTKAELDRIRYTPITARFAPIAELSRQIANQRGLAADLDAGGETNGVLMDVAELWEMYVLSILRKAATPLAVKHGTREKDASKKLLSSDVDGQGLGTLIPDAILYEGCEVQVVADAKYKRLHRSSYSPNGPQREDLYQMAAYLARFTPSVGSVAWGLLAYPVDPSQQDVAPAEKLSPWSLDHGRKVIFTSLPHDADVATQKLRILITQMTSEQSILSA